MFGFISIDHVEAEFDKTCNFMFLFCFLHGYINKITFLADAEQAIQRAAPLMVLYSSSRIVLDGYAM